MLNFITKHLINKIEEYTLGIDYKEMYFFDIPISQGTIKFDKIGRYSLYEKERKIPYSLYQVKTQTLIDVYLKFKENKTYLKKTQW